MKRFNQLSIFQKLIFSFIVVTFLFTMSSIGSHFLIKNNLDTYKKEVELINYKKKELADEVFTLITINSIHNQIGHIHVNHQSLLNKIDDMLAGTYSSDKLDFIIKEYLNLTKVKIKKLIVINSLMKAIDSNYEPIKTNIQKICQNCNMYDSNKVVNFLLNRDHKIIKLLTTLNGLRSTNKYIIIYSNSISQISHKINEISIIDKNLVALFDRIISTSYNKDTIEYSTLTKLEYNNLTLSIIIFFLIVITILSIFYYIIRTGNVTIREIANISSEIARGNFDVKFSTGLKNDQDLSVIINSIDNMSSSLKNFQNDQIRAQFSQLTITALLETSLEQLTMKKQLDLALEIIFTVPWIRKEGSGCIFLKDKSSDVLKMISSINMGDTTEHLCSSLNFGECLCGRAAEQKKTIFASNLDNRHREWDILDDHGHYCIPIMLYGEVLGVLNLKTKAGHEFDGREESFLSTLANTLANIIKRREIEEKLENANKRLKHLAHHDNLTKLPNRFLFKELLEQSISVAQRNNDKMAVLFIDLDKFKFVNDNYGHDIGDLLLQNVSKVLKGSLLRDSDIVAKLGGDEFTILLPYINKEKDAALVAKKIIKNLSSPIQIKEHICNIGASVGIATYPKNGGTMEQLLNSADAAMYTVKKTGRNNYAFPNKKFEKN